MKTILLEKTGSVRKNLEVLEKKIHVKIVLKGRLVSISGEELNEYLASQVIEALSLGFTQEDALLLLEPDFIFEKLEIKNFTKRHNLAEVRARIIGKNGKTKKLVEDLSECCVCLHDNFVGVIGESERIKIAIQALIKIIQGSKQSSVYAYLEKQRTIYHPEDLGLKDQVETEEE